MAKYRSLSPNGLNEVTRGCMPIVQCQKVLIGYLLRLIGCFKRF